MLASVVGKIKLGNPEIDRPRSRREPTTNLAQTWQQAGIKPNIGGRRAFHPWAFPVSQNFFFFFQIIIRNATFFFHRRCNLLFLSSVGSCYGHSHVTTNTKLKTNSLPLLRSWKLVSQACLQITKNRWKHVENKHGRGVLKIPIHKSHYVSLFYLTQCSTSSDIEHAMF